MKEVVDRGMACAKARKQAAGMFKELKSVCMEQSETWKSGLQSSTGTHKRSCRTWKRAWILLQIH